MSKFIHERGDFKDLIEALGSDIKIDPRLIEKDYWIMHALWGLNNLGFEYELKGGTSLSKGWKCIDRFSEDIDIYIHPPEELELPIKKSQTKDSHIKARKEYFDSLAKKLIITGFDSVQRDTAFDDERMRNAGIRLHYPNLFGKIPDLKDGILLEVGFDQTTPNEQITISSWIMDRAFSVQLPDVTNNQAIGVKCYVPEYTLVEKLQTISTKYRKQQADGEMPINFMRHYYDVFQLLQIPRVQDFIGTEGYNAHKDLRFRTGDEKDLTKNDAFIISSAETQKLYQESFEKTKGLYYKGQPKFSDILESFKSFLPRM